MSNSMSDIPLKQLHAHFRELNELIARMNVDFQGGPHTVEDVNWFSAKLFVYLLESVEDLVWYNERIKDITEVVSIQEQLPEIRRRHIALINRVRKQFPHAARERRYVQTETGDWILYLRFEGGCGGSYSIGEDAAEAARQRVQRQQTLDNLAAAVSNDRTLTSVQSRQHDAAPSRSKSIEGPFSRATESKNDRPSPKRGRKPDTDPKVDERIAEAWNSGSYKSYEQLDREMNLAKGTVRRTVDRHRKRQRSPE